MTDISFIYEFTATQLDHAMMIELARLVCPGAEDEFRELLDKIDRGDPISI